MKTVEKIKKPLSIFLFATVIFLIPKAAFAGAVANFVINTATLIGLFFIYILTGFGALALKVAGMILNWVLSPEFIRFSYTNPATNDVIRIGLSVTQGLVNMILILILIYIALATILRLQEYQAQKLLPIFIVIALLVNFTPVICGIIVDASNIIMNFFTSQIQDAANGLTLSMDNGLKSLGDFFLGGISGDWNTYLNKALQKLFIMIFVFMMAFLLLVFAALFMLRYFAIWVLVILSPLAFLAYILPLTRSWWKLWWKQFLNWCFIGATAAFFLYLSLYFVTYMQSSIPVPTETTPETSQAFSDLLPYITGIILLGIGLITALKTSAMGTGAVLAFAASKGRAAVGAVSSRAKRAAGWTARAPARAGAAVAGAVVQKGIRPYTERAVRGAASTVTREISKVPGLRWAIPKRLRRLAEIKPGIEQVMKDTEFESSGSSMAMVLSGAAHGIQATGRVLKTLKRGDSQDIFKEAKKFRRWKGMSDEQILNDSKFQKRMGAVLKDAAQAGMLNTDFLRLSPRLAKVAASQGIGSYAGLSQQEAVSRAVGEARSQHIANWEPEEFNDPEVINATLASFDRDRWLQVSRTIKNGQIEAHKGIDQVFSRFRAGRPDLSHKSDSDVWKNEFRQHIKQNFGSDGYFTGLEDNRMQKANWREGISLQAPTTTPSAADAVELKIEEETKELRSIGEKMQKEREQSKRLKSLGEKLEEKKKEKSKLESILEKRKRKRDKKK